MQTIRTTLILTFLGAAATAGPPALAAEATGNWYVGAGLGQARAKIEDSTVSSVLAGTGATATAAAKHENSFEGKAFVGYQFNRFVAAEGGYFRLGNFSYDATTTPAGTVHGDLKSRMGWNFDVVGTAPIVADRFLLLARLGVQSTKTNDLFAGTGAAAAIRNPAPSKSLVSYKYGVGAEFDFTKNVGVRGEWERYRVSDGFNGKMNVNALTASLLYRF